jgi:hypothetical protein
MVAMPKILKINQSAKYLIYVICGVALIQGFLFHAGSDSSSSTLSLVSKSFVHKPSGPKPHHNQGLVLPLYEGNAALGISFLLHLECHLESVFPTASIDYRELNIEITHCWDLSDKVISLIQSLSNSDRISVVNVCENAMRSISSKAYCGNEGECKSRFKGFAIKILSLLLSRFDEVSLIERIFGKECNLIFIKR